MRVRAIDKPHRTSSYYPTKWNLRDPRAASLQVANLTIENVTKDRLSICMLLRIHWRYDQSSILYFIKNCFLLATFHQANKCSWGH